MGGPAADRAGLAALVGAGALLGLGHWPGLGALAWAGVGLTAWALGRPLLARALVGGLVAAGFARVLVGHPWHLPGLDPYLPGGMEAAWLAILPYDALYVLPLALALAAGSWGGRRAGLPAWLWLPLAWWLGEAAQDALLGLSHDAWLYSQYQAAPVLRAVGQLGWTPALLGCLALAAAATEAVTGRFQGVRARLAAAVMALGLAGLALLPALPPASPTAFAGVGAVHMADDRHPPREAPPGLSLLVWPELADRQRPRLAEGPGDGAYVEPPFRAPGLHHLYGLKTRAGKASQNALLALDPDGRVLATRAKARLFPLTERPLLGWLAPGATRYVPGEAPPVLEAAGRKVGTLLCVEAVDRGLAARAKAAGADLLAIATLEVGLAASPLGREQVLAVAVLRAVETGLPVVRASTWGDGAFIGPDGAVVARSRPGEDGILTATADHARAWPAREPTAPPADGLVVLYSRHTPTMLPALACDGCPRYAVEGFRDPGRRAATVIVSGDSVPPRYLGRPAAELAAAVAAFRPSLVVLDTCFGASSPLLEALAARGVRATVVAPAYRIPARGLDYMPGFLAEPDAAKRALRVRAEPPAPLLRWAIDPAQLAAARAGLEDLGPRELRQRLKLAGAGLVRANLPGRPGPDGRVLVALPPARFRAWSSVSP